VSFDGHELDAAARERPTAAGAEFVAELALAAALKLLRSGTESGGQAIA